VWTFRVLNLVMPTSCSQFKLCIHVSGADFLLTPGAMFIPICRETGIRQWRALHFRCKDYNIINRHFTLYSVVFVQAAMRLLKEIIGSVLIANHAVQIVITTYKLKSVCN